MAASLVPTDLHDSDKEVEAGLPSPDASDDDEIQKSTEIGIVVSAFCNKLREQTRPLLRLSQGVPSPTKQLRDNGGDKPKESKAKKRLFKGRQPPSSGVIERRYGYIPNPRWPKAPFPQTKAFEPVGVSDVDREGIPGVVFRDAKKLDSREHSYQENDFPELNGSQGNRSSPQSDLSASSVSASCVEDKTKNLSSQSRQELLAHDSSISINGRRLSQNSYISNNDSPNTSTPLRPGHSTTPSPLGHFLDNSFNASDSFGNCSSGYGMVKGRSPEPTLQRISSRKAKKLSPSPLAHIPLHDSDGSLNDSASSDFKFKHETSLSSEVFDKSCSWSEKLKSPRPLTPIESESESHAVNDVLSSSKQNDVNHNCNSPAVMNGLFLSDSGKISSPFNSNRAMTPSLTSPVTLATTITSSSSWSDIAKCSPTAGQRENTSPQLVHSDKVLPCMAADKNSINSTQQSQQLSSSVQAKTNNESEKNQNKKSSRSRNRRGKNSGQGTENESKGKKQQTVNVNNSLQNNNKHQTNNRGNNRNTNNGPRSITLESFMTPQKPSGRKNGPSNGKKDISLLHNRFVGQLDANPISPPKKIRPSPVKRLSFSKKQAGEMDLNASGVSESGDARLQNPLHEDCAKLQTVCEMLGRKLSGTQNQQQSSSARKSNKDQKFCKVGSQDDVNDDENRGPSSGILMEAEAFWTIRPVEAIKISSVSKDMKDEAHQSSDEDDDDEDGVCITPFLGMRIRGSLHSNQEDAIIVDGVEQAEPSKVTHRLILRKYARRYCHFIEEHLVPNVAVELYFIIQLLTCTEVDRDILKFLDKQRGGTYFHSVHNGVYFAVTVMKKLRHLFLALDKTYLRLLATCSRIHAFSPSLYKVFTMAVGDRMKDPAMPSQLEYTVFNPMDNGIMSFPDSNHAHVFKCQRDNFYAFYRHYHDTSSVYEFRIENQIQYVYDGCTPEQNSVVNFMHLAKLYLDHLILCCVKQAGQQVDVIQMIQSKGQDEELYTKLYEAFFEASSASSGTACPPPGFTEDQMFFKDFIDTLSCPAFNEHLRNLVVYKILELNSTNFSTVTNLHSAVAMEENKTPLRTERFTETVLTLCMLGKLLGHLTFFPYTSGANNIPLDRSEFFHTMREMVPLPLPLPLLLKQAFENGHLCLTIPWLVEYLAMMDLMAPQLSVYKAMLRKLHYIQRYAWEKLYKEGHHNAGLLVVSCISWLFESPSVPAGFFFSCDATKEELVTSKSCNSTFQIDCQKMVSQRLLSRCCPYLEQGQVLLTLYALKQKPVIYETQILPHSVVEDSGKPSLSSGLSEDISEIEQWLGSSLAISSEVASSEAKKPTKVIDDEIIPAYVLNHMLARKDTDDLEDMEHHLLQSNPYLKAAVDTAVDLMSAKVADYTQKMILKLLVFDTKITVRSYFKGVPVGNESEAVKNQLLAQANVMANNFSEKAKDSFAELCDRINSKELPELLCFLTSHVEEDFKNSAIHITKKMVARRLHEWAKVQLGSVLFQRIIVREVDRCAKTNPKYMPLYPNDYTKRTEEKPCPELQPGLTELEQLSELIDKALSYGVWYINALSPGPRPDDSHMIQLIADFTSCIEKKMITMDFAFNVMANFLMHLIIQYMVDAPHNWTSEAAEAFVKLCHLCRERKLEYERQAIKMPDNVRKKRNLDVKVSNLMSVYSVQWLTRSETQNETLMVYCKLLHQLVEAQLLSVEAMSKKLIQTRDNVNLDSSGRILVNKVLVKVLEMLWTSLQDNKSFSQTRILKIIEHFVAVSVPRKEAGRGDMRADLVLRIKATFGMILEAASNS